MKVWNIKLGAFYRNSWNKSRNGASWFYFASMDNDF